MDTSGIGRREFITASAGMASLAALAGSTAIAVADDSAAAASLADVEPVNTIVADIVVCGSGGCGLACATRSAELGLKTVLVEQSDFVGGTTLLTEGFFGVNTRLQEECGIELTLEECFTKSMNYNHWEGDGALAMEFFSSSAENFAWVESQGIRFTKACPNGASLPTWHVYEEDDSGITGALYIAAMAQSAMEKGVDIQLNTSAQELIMNDGKVAGVLCTTEAGVVRVEAPAVMLATGGYSDNADMVRGYANIDPDRIFVSGLGARNGEGIKMGLSAGGSMNAYPGCLMYYGGQVVGSAFGTPLFAAFCGSPILWVNNHGRRFTSEEWAATNFSYYGNSHKGQKATYSVINQAVVDMFVNEGVLNDMGQYVHQGDKLPTLPDDIAEMVESMPDYYCRAETVEELAEWIGCDAETLAASLDSYNACCAAGVDTEFSKPAEWMVAVDGGPYFATKVKIGSFTTCGGLKVDTNACVIDEDEKPIPGLFAGGSDAGGLYGASYDVVICTGSQQGWAVHTGKRAAESAAKYLGR